MIDVININEMASPQKLLGAGRCIYIVIGRMSVMTMAVLKGYM